MSAAAWCLMLGLMAGGSSAVADVLRPHPLDSKRYFESTTVLALLDDGTYVQALVAVSNIGLGNGEGACRVQLAPPQGKAESFSQQVDADKWRFASTPTPALHMGPCQLSATASGLQLDVGLDALQLSMTLQRPAQVTTPPGMPLKLEEGVYESQVLVPFAPAEVVLVRSEAAPRTLHGFGYAEHARSTALPKHMGQGALRFRGFAPGCSTLLYARWVNKVPSGYLWREGDKAPQPLAGWQLDLPQVDAAAQAVRVRAQGKSGQSLQLQARRRWFRSAPLEDYGLLGKMVGAWMGSVVNETFAAELDAGGACTHVPGVLEIDHNS